MHWWRVIKKAYESFEIGTKFIVFSSMLVYNQYGNGDNYLFSRFIKDKLNKIFSSKKAFYVFIFMR